MAKETELNIFNDSAFITFTRSFLRPSWTETGLFDVSCVHTVQSRVSEEFKGQTFILCQEGVSGAYGSSQSWSQHVLTTKNALMVKVLRMEKNLRQLQGGKAEPVIKLAKI